MGEGACPHAPHENRRDGARPSFCFPWLRVYTIRGCTKSHLDVKLVFVILDFLRYNARPFARRRTKWVTQIARKRRRNSPAR